MSKIDYKIIVAIVIAITILESIALLKGINGILLTTVIGALCLLGGVAVPMDKIIKK